MELLPGIAPALGRARGAAGPAAGWVLRGLVQVLSGPDRPLAWRWRSPAQRRAGYTALGAVTLALCLISAGGMRGLPQAGAGPPHHLPLSAGQLLLAVAVVAPLPVAARYPLLGWRIGWLALALAPLVPADWWGGWPWGPVQILVLLAAFCLAGARHQRPVLWWMWALSLIPFWLWASSELADLNGPVSTTVAVTAATFALDYLSSSRRRAERALSIQTERTQLEQARRAVLEERARIARELHDVVAHHMSLIAVRAETAPYRLAGLPEPVRGEFSALSAAAREALADMRRLLGVLRHDQPAARGPAPQLSDLPVLVDTARRAGVAVELSVPAVLGHVPAGVGVCAYRIVQESLSNARRHAPGAAVTVSVSVSAGPGTAAVVLRIANSRPGSHRNGVETEAGNGPGPGLGLTGMRERVTLLGGWLSAGPAPDGGYIVSAVLPLGEAA